MGKLLSAPWMVGNPFCAPDQYLQIRAPPWARGEGQGTAGSRHLDFTPLFCDDKIQDVGGGKSRVSSPRGVFAFSPRPNRINNISLVPFTYYYTILNVHESARARAPTHCTPDTPVALRPKGSRGAFYEYLKSNLRAALCEMRKRENDFRGRTTPDTRTYNIQYTIGDVCACTCKFTAAAVVGRPRS